MSITGVQKRISSAICLSQLPTRTQCLQCQCGGLGTTGDGLLTLNKESLIKRQGPLSLDQGPGVKVSRNAVLGPGNLSLERSGCTIIGFHSRNLRCWTQQVSNRRYSTSDS